MTSRTLYQILQVDSEASPEVIEAAYRRLARILHPDVNSAPDALRRMQEINVAFETLKDPAKRLRYDLDLAVEHARRQAPASSSPASSPGATPQAKPAPPSAQPARPVQPWNRYAPPPIPMHCEACGRSDESLRYAAFPYVVSVLVVTFRRGWSGLYCAQCRRAQMAKARMLSLGLGWWGIPWGPIWTLGALFESMEGRVPPEVNAPYLGTLGLRFLQAGEMAKGIAALQASLNYQHDAEVVELLVAARKANGTVVPESVSSCAGARTQTAVRTEDAPPAKHLSEWQRYWGIALIGALLIICLFILLGLNSGAGSTTQEATSRAESTTWQDAAVPRSAAQATLTLEPTVAPTATPVRKVKVLVEDVYLYAGPSIRYSRYLPLEVGQSVTVLAQQQDCRWLLVETELGAIAWLRASGNRVSPLPDCNLIELGTYQPETGILSPAEGRFNLGALEVKNDTETDTVIVVVDQDGTTEASAYMRAGDTYVIQGIAYGSYDVYAAFGSEWNGSGFTQLHGMQRFDEPFDYSSSEPYGWTISLKPIADGNLRAIPVSESSFPLLGN